MSADLAIEAALSAAEPQAPRAPSGRDRAEVRRAAEAFEALFLQTLVRRMAEAQLENGFFGGGAGASVYEGMFEQHLSQGVASGSPLGIADLLEERWLGGLERPRSSSVIFGAQVPPAAADEVTEGDSSRSLAGVNER